MWPWLTWGVITDLLKINLGFKTVPDAESAYDDLTRFYVLKKPYPFHEGLETIITEVGKVIPKAANLKFNDIANPGDHRKAR